MSDSDSSIIKYPHNVDSMDQICQQHKFMCN